jgi:hypothetical protein
MKFSTSAVIASTLAIATASPVAVDPFAATKPSGNDVFRVMSLRTGTPIQFGNVQAVKGGLRIGYPKQSSSCVEPDANYASFSLTENGDLYLYTANPPLQAYVDRSGMGQGVLRFTTGVQPIGKNQERGPFKIDDESNLYFSAINAEGGRIGFQACPAGEGEGYAVWLSTVSTPAQIEGCIPFTAKALREEKPNKCLYNEMSN